MTDTPASPGDTENHTDGCLCDIEIDDLDIVDDVDLPAASGGVLVVRSDGDDDETEGPDFELSEADATRDEELPPAVGGALAAPS